MKIIFATLSLSVLLSASAVAREQSVLARVTVYWRGGSSGERAAWNGARLHTGHCAVDPEKIPFGSKVIFADATCTAVDTGPDVVNRKAARLLGRNERQRNAIIVDRFFETKEAAMAWVNSHPHFMTLRVLTPEPRSRQVEVTTVTTSISPPPPAAQRRTRAPQIFQQPRASIAMGRDEAVSRDARRRTGAAHVAVLPPTWRYDDSFA